MLVGKWGGGAGTIYQPYSCMLLLTTSCAATSGATSGYGGINPLFIQIKGWAGGAENIKKNNNNNTVSTA